MKITDIKQDREHLNELITKAGYELEGNSNDAVIGRIMRIIASQYLEHVIQKTHLATINERP